MATGCDRVRLIWLCENTQRLCAARYIHVQHYLWVKGRASQIAVPTRKHNPVVAWKRDASYRGCWLPLIVKWRIRCVGSGTRRLEKACNKLLPGDRTYQEQHGIVQHVVIHGRVPDVNLREASVGAAPERRIDRAQVVEEILGVF